MNLKGKIEAKIRLHKISLVLDLLTLGLSFGLQYGAGIAWYWLLPLMFLGTYGLLNDAECIWTGYSILRSPLLYLVAVQHDLGDDEQRAG